MFFLIDSDFSCKTIDCLLIKLSQLFEEVNCPNNIPSAIFQLRSSPLIIKCSIKPKFNCSAGFVLLCVMSVVDLFGVAMEVFFKSTAIFSPVNYNTVPLLCDMFLITEMPSIKASSLLVMMMSIERFYAAFYPFQYKQKVKVSTLIKVGTVFFCNSKPN